MAVIPQAVVTAPPRVPAPFGLFSVMTVRPSEGRWETGVTWQSITCESGGGLSSTGSAFAAPFANPFGGSALPNGFPLVGEAHSFTVYGVCRTGPVTVSLADAEAMALAHLVATEEAVVENDVWLGTLSGGPFLADAATTVVPSAATAAATLGALEQAAAASFGSGVLHMTRATATVLAAAEVVTSKGGQLTTILGTPVVAGTGYPGTGPSGASAGDQTKTGWVYATPQVFGYRSEPFTNAPFNAPTNDILAVAERQYVVGYDPCGVLAALVP